MVDHFDVVIAGGGLVGASLACSLADSDLRIAVVEPHAWNTKQQPSYDERTVALTWSARQIYTGMGLWQEIINLGATPIKEIHISNQGHFGMTHLCHTDVGTAALGYVVPTRVLGQVLHTRLNSAENVTLLCPASVTKTNPDTKWSNVEIQGDTDRCRITAALVVVADGGRSTLSNQFKPQVQQYDQQALVTIVSTDQPHQNRAYERFTKEGPLALLPLSEQRYAVVWTSEPNQLERRLTLNDEEFIRALQTAFGDRAGNLEQPAARNTYPLLRSGIESPIADRMLVIGNAAHSVHPVAGQGFNLGLRDVAELADCLYQAAIEKSDPGDNELLYKYALRRKQDTRMVGQFTHGLVELFSNEIWPLGVARNLALNAVEMFPPAKKFLLRRTMGLTGNQPTLAMGLPLRHWRIRCD